jgi:predicted transcriptional regulator
MIRATTDMDDDLKKEIKEMAQKNNWAFSYMCYILLQQAVKERKRKRKNAKEIQI